MLRLAIINRLFALLFLVALFGACDNKRIDCTNVPKEKWLSKEQFHEQVSKMGYEVKDLNVYQDNCYQVVGFDPSREKGEFFFNPVDGKLVDRRITKQD